MISHPSSLGFECSRMSCTRTTETNMDGKRQEAEPSKRMHPSIRVLGHKHKRWFFFQLACVVFSNTFQLLSSWDPIYSPSRLVLSVHWAGRTIRYFHFLYTSLRPRALRWLRRPYYRRYSLRKAHKMGRIDVRMCVHAVVHVCDNLRCCLQEIPTLLNLFFTSMGVLPAGMSLHHVHISWWLQIP